MSAATESTTRRAERWRAAYDVAIGVVLFVSLLLPAVRQASTGTLSGLRNGLVLLLLDLVVLVMLSRYVTRPSRPPAGRSATPVVARGAVSSLWQGEAPLDGAGAPREEVTGLGFTDEAVTVVDVGSSSRARLAWCDCAAVVLSQVTLANGTTFVYLQFVAVHEERIHRGTGDPRTKALAQILALTESAAAMVWVVDPEHAHLPPLVLQHVEREHPHVRVVRPEGDPDYSLTEE